MMDHYILDGHTPVACDMMTWARSFEKTDRRVAKTVKDEISVSTVFLGLNHQYDPSGPPLLFETMIFGGEHDEDCTRCSTWEEAEKMHAEACKLAFGEPT